MHIKDACIPCGVAVAVGPLDVDAAVADAVDVLLPDEITLLTSTLPASGDTCAELLSESTLGSLCSVAVPVRSSSDEKGDMRWIRAPE